MHWMLGYVLLHVTQIVLITMAPELLTNTYSRSLCASTVGCSMEVGLERIHFNSMDPVCKANREQDLGDVLKIGDVRMAMLTCSGSMRCCSRCTLPLPSTTAPGNHVQIRARDELHNSFQICVVIMIGFLAIQLLHVLVLACSEQAIKVAEQKCDEIPLILAKDNLRNKEHLARGWRVAGMVCIVASLVLLVTEMIILIALVLMPAVALVRNLSCFIYVLAGFVLVLSIYCCMGLVIEKCIAFNKKLYKEPTCFATCIWKAILSAMASIMWLVLIAGFIIGSIYCAIITNQQ